MRWIVGTVLLLATLTACEKSPFEPIEPLEGLPSSTPVDVKKADPPTRFTDKPSSTLEITTQASEVILHGLTAIAPIHGNGPLASRDGAELRFVDTRTGATTHSVKPTHPLLKTETRFIPTLATVDGRPTVLMPFIGETPAQGTTPGRPLLEIVSVNPDNAEVGWRFEIPLDGWKEPGPGSNTVTEAMFAGVDNGIAVLGLESDNRTSRTGDTYALDLASRKVLWRQAGFVSRGVASGVVVGSKQGADKTPLLGLDVRTGQRKWASPRVNASRIDVHPAGPTKVVVDGSDGQRFLEVVDIASGRVTGTKTGGILEVSVNGCVYDQRSVVVCYNGDQWISGLDPTTGDWTWGFTKDDGRLIPSVTGAWHGVVYGWVDNLRWIVLDAKTGADRETNPGTAPSVVNESMAIGPWPGGGRGSSIYPVTG